MTNNEYTFEDLKKDVKDFDFVLVGIGKEFSMDSDKNKSLILDAYNSLFELLSGNNYFIVSLNTDDVIFGSKLDSERIVTPCGSVNRYQCYEACTDELWNEPLSECPHCKGAICTNTANQPNYVEKGYLNEWNNYTKWLMGTMGRKLLCIELGASMDYPSVIRWAFEKTVYVNNNAKLIRINEILPQLPPELKDKGIAVKKNSLSLFSVR